MGGQGSKMLDFVVLPTQTSEVSYIVTIPVSPQGSRALNINDLRIRKGRNPTDRKRGVAYMKKTIKGGGRVSRFGEFF